MIFIAPMIRLKKVERDRNKTIKKLQFLMEFQKEIVIIEGLMFFNNPLYTIFRNKCRVKDLMFPF